MMLQSKIHSAFVDQVLQLSSHGIWSQEHLNTLERISSQLAKDLQPPTGFYFSHAIRSEIEQKAALELSQRLQTLENFSQLEAAWQNIVRDFYSENRWGFPTQRTQPAKILSSEQKIRKELAAYIGFLIAVLFLIKNAFYIFGMLGSNYQDEPSYTYGFWISLVVLMALTGYFGWKKYNQPQ